MSQPAMSVFLVASSLTIEFTSVPPWGAAIYFVMERRLVIQYDHMILDTSRGNRRRTMLRVDLGADLATALPVVSALVASPMYWNATLVEMRTANTRKASIVLLVVLAG